MGLHNAKADLIRLLEYGMSNDGYKYNWAVSLKHFDGYGNIN